MPVHPLHDPINTVIPNQRFPISCAGLRPNTRHYFTFNGVDKSAACRQTGKALGEALITNSTGQIQFEFYFEFNEGRPGSGYEELLQQIESAISTGQLTSPGSTIWDFLGRTAPIAVAPSSLFFNCRLASTDGESFCNGRLGTAINQLALHLDIASFSSDDWRWTYAQAFLDGGYAAADAVDQAKRQETQGA